MNERINEIELFGSESSATQLPFVGDIVAGFPSPADDYMDKALSLDSILITDKSATILGKINGDSMKSANLEDGDVIVIDRSKTAKDGDVVICRLNSEFTCKRLQIIGANEKILLVPENKDFPSIEIESTDDFIIDGVVTYVIKKISGNKTWKL